MDDRRQRRYPMSEDMMTLDLEYRLTIAFRSLDGCECVPYFIERREVLIPAMLERAREIDSDPADVFAAFARGVHARHEQEER